jgi:predicted PurR-regulated permease PerM
MVAERALRAAQVAEEDSRRAADAAAEAAEQERERRPGPFAPFRIGLLGGLGLLLAYTLYLSLDTIRSTLIVIAIAAILAIGLDPPVGLLMRRGVKRGAAVAIVFGALLVFIGGALYAIVPAVIEQIGTAVSSLPDLIASLQRNPTIQGLDAKFGIIKALQNSDFIKNIGGQAAGGIVTVGFTVAGIAVDLVIALILTLYFLAGLPRIKASAYRLVPASRRVRVSEIGDKILKQMGGYLGGATLIALQAGIVAGLFSAIIGLPFPWAIGLAATLLDFVPVVGPIIIGVGMTLLGFTQSLIIGIVAGGFYLCQHLFEAYWLYPRVMRRTVDISTAAVIVAIIVGGALLGVTGAILAVPFAAAVQLVVREVVVPMQERS